MTTAEYRDRSGAPDAEFTAALAAWEAAVEVPGGVVEKVQLAAVGAVGDMPADSWCPKRRDMRREECKFCVAEVAAVAALAAMKGPEAEPAVEAGAVGRVARALWTVGGGSARPTYGRMAVVALAAMKGPAPSPDHGAAVARENGNIADTVRALADDMLTEFGPAAPDEDDVYDWLIRQAAAIETHGGSDVR